MHRTIERLHSAEFIFKYLAVADIFRILRVPSIGSIYPLTVVVIVIPPPQEWNDGVAKWLL